MLNNSGITVERRRFPRLPTILDVDYSLSGREHLRNISFARNIGSGGICMITYEDLSLDSTLFSKITLPNSGDSFQVKAKIIWKKEEIVNSSLKKRFDVGLEFTEIKQGDCQKISEFVASSSV